MRNTDLNLAAASREWRSGATPTNDQTLIENIVLKCNLKGLERYLGSFEENLNVVPLTTDSSQYRFSDIRHAKSYCEHDTVNYKSWKPSVKN